MSIQSSTQRTHSEYVYVAGPSYDKAGRERVFTVLDEWMGLRAQAGRVRPKGFPTDGLMGPAFANRL